MKKLILALLLLSLLMASLTGCGIDDLVLGFVEEYKDNKDSINSEIQELKDGFESEVKDWIGSVSQYSLTRDKDLKGRRKCGEDNYAGTYRAGYKKFNGREYIFGSTPMKQKHDRALMVTYSMHIQSGKAVLYWLESTDEHVIFGNKEKHIIAEADDEDICSFTVNAGGGFLVFEGDDFTGNLSLQVK